MTVTALVTGGNSTAWGSQRPEVTHTAFKTLCVFEISCPRMPILVSTPKSSPCLQLLSQPCQLHTLDVFLPVVGRRHWLSWVCEEKRLCKHHYGPAIEMWRSMTQLHRGCRQRGMTGISSSALGNEGTLPGIPQGQGATNRSGAELQTCHFYNELHAILDGDLTSTLHTTVDISEETETLAVNCEEGEGGDTRWGSSHPMRQDPFETPHLAISTMQACMSLMKGKETQCLAWQP
ncbi:uncharacterized protein LOC120373196 isoform X2 [Mauremys reevesii]|uniref:uncharacterized protein LOC120373196 isoform X2 n=1 Tax=Mauremys reevesii TaxID=260615 RepID=UPI00193F3624|nr:uncharacterized protein LOC120373196 isoform X2 [Mauremys reevesii]